MTDTTTASPAAHPMLRNQNAAYEATLDMLNHANGHRLDRTDHRKVFADRLETRLDTLLDEWAKELKGYLEESGHPLSDDLARIWLLTQTLHVIDKMRDHSVRTGVWHGETQTNLEKACGIGETEDKPSQPRYLTGYLIRRYRTRAGLYIKGRSDKSDEKVQRRHPSLMERIHELFGEDTTLTNAVLNNIESQGSRHREPTPRELYQIATALGVPMINLIVDVEDPFAESPLDGRAGKLNYEVVGEWVSGIAPDAPDCDIAFIRSLGQETTLRNFNRAGHRGHSETQDYPDPDNKPMPGEDPSIPLAEDLEPTDLPSMFGENSVETLNYPHANTDPDCDLGDIGSEYLDATGPDLKDHSDIDWNAVTWRCPHCGEVPAILVRKE